MALIYLTKTFDNMNQDALKKLITPENMLIIIISFNKGINVSDEWVSDSFGIINKMKQDCLMDYILIALFFKIMLMHVFDSLEKTNFIQVVVFFTTIALKPKL